MIKVNVHTGGQGVLSTLPLDQISDVLERKDSLLWIDVVAPTAEDVRLLGEEFRFHPLAMEDATRPHERPKVDFYDGFLFIVFYAMETQDQRPGAVEINLFVGPNYLVTVHDDTMPVLSETADRWTQNIAQLGNRGVGLLVYSLLDAVVDGYFPCIDALSERVEGLEEAIFERSDTRSQQAIFRLKKDLLHLRKIVAPERDVMNILVRRDTPVFGADTVPYFQDVYDHILRVSDAVDTYRDLLSSALDSYLSVTSNRLNQVMKTLTASSIILMSITLIASIYGMNFDYMPELHWHYGYFGALSLMTLIGAVLFTVFRRIDWF